VSDEGEWKLMNEEMSQLFVRESSSGYMSSHKELKVYRRAFDLALRVQKIADTLPSNEQRRLADQIIRSSRSVCSNIAEAWRKRRYRPHFVSKMSDAEGEAAETQTWLEFASALEYAADEALSELDREYEQLLGSLVGIISHADKWATLPKPK
jgi:four helix bundle protein